MKNYNEKYGGVLPPKRRKISKGVMLGLIFGIVFVLMGTIFFFFGNGKEIAIESLAVVSKSWRETLNLADNHLEICKNFILQHYLKIADALPLPEEIIYLIK